MQRNTSAQENILELADAQFKIAHQECNDCKSYHAIWPYLRLSNMVGGVEADEPFLGPIIFDLIEKGARDILLAGSADSGVTALLHRASKEYANKIRVCVLDRCTTPLMACHEYALSQGLELTHTKSDLTKISMQSSFDLVIGHSVIPFISPHERRNVLAGLSASLRAGGFAILSFRVMPSGTSHNLSAEDVHNLALAITDKLRSKAVKLPCAELEFHSLINSFFLDHANKTHQFSEVDTLKDDLNAVGLEVIKLEKLGRGGRGDFEAKPVGWAYVAVRR